MNQKVAKNHITLRFRRWSRKGYAVFASLTCAVTIGVLAISISEKSAQKTEGTKFLTSVSPNSESESCEANDDILLNLETQKAILNTQSSDDAAARSCDYIVLTKRLKQV